MRTLFVRIVECLPIRSRKKNHYVELNFYTSDVMRVNLSHEFQSLTLVFVIDI